MKNLTLIISLLLFSLSVQSQSWTEFKRIYSDQQLEVEISYRNSETACDRHGRSSKYRYKISGKLYTTTAFLVWKIKYIDCNGITYIETNSVNVGRDGIDGIIESLDYTFNSKKVDNESYDVSLSTIEKKDKREFIFLETILPQNIVGSNTIYKGEQTILSINGGQIGTGAKWQWHKDSCDGELIGYGESISISPNQNTTYFFKSVLENKSSNCISHHVDVINGSKLPSEILGENSICQDRSTKLYFPYGILGEHSEWVWLENSCSGKEIGRGNSIMVSPKTQTTYFLKAIGEYGTEDCISKTVSIGTFSSIPISISTQKNSVCLGESIKLQVNGGTLGQGAEWTWYKNIISPNNKIGIGTSIEEKPTTSTIYIVRAEGPCNKTEGVSINIEVLHIPTEPNSISALSAIFKGKKTDLKIDNTLSNNWKWTLNNCDGEHIGTGQSITYKFKKATTISVIDSNSCGKSNCYIQTFYPTKSSSNKSHVDSSKNMLLGFDLGGQTITFLPSSNSSTILLGVAVEGGLSYYPLFKKMISLGLSANYSVGTFVNNNSPVEVSSKSSIFSILQPKIEFAVGLNKIKLLTSYSNKMYSEKFTLRDNESSIYSNSYRQDNIGLGLRIGSNFRNTRAIFFDVSYLFTRKYNWAWDNFNWKFKTEDDWNHGVSTSIWVHNAIKIEGEFLFKDIHSQNYNKSFRVGVKYTFNRYY
ncbi:MAG TPA: hypothetical protein VLZ75_01585 [Chitinophagales bacterium]|nr:hypothetical protein [Chitinophagales bacterium]